MRQPGKANAFIKLGIRNIVNNGKKGIALCNVRKRL